MSERVYEVEDDGDDARELEQPQSAVQVDEPDDDEPTAADLYDEGTGWTADRAVEVAPEEPYAWDARTVADAAFARYLRAATDFAGGRRITLDR